MNATSSFEWQAIANLLLKSKPPGFGFRLLEGLRLRLTVYVTDDPNRGFGSALGRAVEHGTNYVFGVAGFPPLAEYQFVLGAPGATILSIGPQTVHYTRWLRSPAVVPPMTHSTLAKPRDVDRVQYVNALVSERFEGALLRRESSVTVVWTNAQALRRDVSTHRTRVDELYRRVVSLLVLSKRLWRWIQK